MDIPVEIICIFSIANRYKTGFNTVTTVNTVGWAERSEMFERRGFDALCPPYKVRDSE
jgi:hypothetical protein